MATSPKTPLVVVGVGLCAFVVAQFIGVLADWQGKNGELVGIPFGQAVILLSLFFRDPLGLPHFKWGRGWVKGAALGVLVVLAVFTLNYYWSELLSKCGVSYSEQSMVSKLRIASPIELAFISIVAGFWAPFIEEVYFRGWLQGLALERLSEPVAIISIAFLFALLHANLALFPGLFLLALCLGYAARVWGVGAAIVAHCFFNWATIIAARSGLF